MLVGPGFQTYLLSCRRTSELNASMEEAQAPKAPSTSDANAPSDEFLELKKKLLSRAKKGAGSVAVYIFLQQGITVRFPSHHWVLRVNGSEAVEAENSINCMLHTNVILKRKRWESKVKEKEGFMTGNSFFM